MKKDFLSEVIIVEVKEMWKLCLSTFLSLIVVFCGTTSNIKGKVENAIGNKIRETCVNGRECSINISDITWFDWDKMIFFPGGLTSSDINHILGKEQFAEKKFPFSITLVFFKDGEIVYTEENFRDIEDNNNGDIYFSDVDPIKRYRLYSRDNSFSVERKLIRDDEYYYWLKCKNCS